MNILETKILDAFNRHSQEPDKLESELNKMATEHKEIYKNSLYLVSHISLEENEAKKEFKNIKNHHGEMKSKLNADLDIRVSILDYFLSNVSRIENPKIIEMKIFQTTKDLILKDELTGLYNYRHFYQTIRDEMKKALKFGTPLSLLMIDVDNFKNINDTFGHLKGDEVLSGIAKFLRNFCQDFMSCFRYGGEEFAIVGSNIDKVQAKEVADNLVSEINKNPIVIKNAEDSQKVTVSIGVASVPYDARSVELLIGNADKALYTAKSGGKNKAELYSDNMRQYNRFPLILDGNMKKFGDEEYKISTVDVSDGGLSIISDEPLLPGEVLELRFVEGNSTHRRLCRVSRKLNEKVSGKYCYGIEYCDKDLNFSDWIRKKIFD